MGDRGQGPEQQAETDRLIARFQGGDREAFTVLYKLYLERVFNYLRVVLKDEHEAEDGTQEFFARMLEALPTYEIRGAPFDAWVFKVLRNYSLEVMELRNRVEPEDPAELNRRRDANGETAESLDEDVMRRLSDRDLLVFIRRMPLLQRQVVVMRFMLDMSVAQVARTLDRSPDSIRQAQLRAAKFLRKRFAHLGRAPASYQDRQPSERLFQHAEVLRHRRFVLNK